MKKSNIVFVPCSVLLLLCSVLLLLSLNYPLYQSITEQKSFKEQYIEQAQERYDEIYEERYEKDYEQIQQEEEIRKVEQVRLREEELIKTYWKEAKSIPNQELASITQEFPEVFADLVVQDIKSGHYTDLNEYFIINYPASRFVDYPIEAKCKEFNASREECALMLAVAGVESSMDTNYVTHWRERDIEGGRNRNNPWGLKMNRRYANLKGLQYVTKPPYDNYSFVSFTTFDSGIKFFIEFLKIEYKGASKPSHLHPNFNDSKTWLDKCNKFYDIILPLIKY